MKSEAFWLFAVLFLGCVANQRVTLPPNATTALAGPGVPINLSDMTKQLDKLEIYFGVSTTNPSPSEPAEIPSVETSGATQKSPVENARSVLSEVVQRIENLEKHVHLQNPSDPPPTISPVDIDAAALSLVAPKPPGIFNWISAFLATGALSFSQSRGTQILAQIRSRLAKLEQQAQPQDPKKPPPTIGTSGAKPESVLEQ